MNKYLHPYLMMSRLYGFLLRVLRGFTANQGFLLSGAVAYYTLLSIVPLSILALVFLSHFIEEQQLVLTLSMYLEMVIPGYATMLTEQVQSFLKHRDVISIIGFISMLFFSSTAFSMLENAISEIFLQRFRIKPRRFLISAIIPYLYIFCMGVGILLVSCVVGGIETLESGHLAIKGWRLDLGAATWMALYILGIVGEVALFTSIYMLLPVFRVRFRYGLIGGITAAVLWEVVRRLLIWYYAKVTMVNVIYGSIAITVVSLISIQVVAMILLLGAQVIAELEQNPERTEKP